uniref:Uncharacterized protein n=1 Tax=Anguilla anguilla TaxID=7936 RepID=A0A0E9PPK5_ANGAN
MIPVNIYINRLYIIQQEFLPLSTFSFL